MNSIAPNNRSFARSRTIWRRLILSALAITSCVVFRADAAGFTLEESDRQLTILEAGKPVLTYNFGRVDPPAGVDVERYWRSSYIHPLYGLDGEIMTDDFPEDHYHHRGVFWTWPETMVGERKIDVWTIIGAHQLFQRWLKKETSPDRVEVGVENGWFFDGDPKPKVLETIFFTAHPAQETFRALDFHLKFTNVCDEDVTFEGAKDKGYGGFSFRPNADNKPFSFLTAKGIVPEDALSFETPWASISWQRKDGAGTSGIAMMQHPSNPGFPHPGWIFRHYGFLGVCWPHEQTHILKPGESFELKYRMLVQHNLDGENALGDLFKQYMDESTKH